MFKRFFCLILSQILLASSYGAYLKNVPQTITQPNGVKINCFASGDEYHNWLHDSAGYTIIQDTKTGYYTYALKQGDELIASSYIVGEVNPDNLKIEKGVNISSEKWLNIRKEFEADIPYEAKHKSVKRNHGTINNLVFFIRFSDDEGYNIDNYNNVNKKFNDTSSGTANSLANYYKTISYGKLNVRSHLFPSSDSTVINSYQDIYPRAYFTPYHSTNNPTGYQNSTERKEREHNLLIRAITFFRDSIPSGLTIDYDNDGRVDNVCFIIAGTAQGWQNLLWPHRWSLYDNTVYINGKRVYDYNLITEDMTYTGVITHEFMHTLGAPDLYRYDENYNDISPVGFWDLMASTNYSKPQGLGAYMKYKYGNWLDSIPTIYENGTYTLFPANGSSSDKIAYKIPFDNEYSEEYIIVEYRKVNSSTFESSLPGSGLLIYRINSNFNGNASYDNLFTFDEVYIYRPGGTTQLQGMLTYAYFNESEGRTSFNASSNPKPFLTDGTIINNFSITNISNATDSIRFTIGLDTTYLSVDSNYLFIKNELDHTDSFNISTNDNWTIHCDTSWISISPTKGSGNQQIYVKSKQINTTSINRKVELSVVGTSKIKTITIAQNGISFDSCMVLSNLFENDTFVEFNFSTNNPDYYVAAASEYYSVFDPIFIDSISIYFGNVGFTNNDTVFVKIMNTSSLRYPTNLLKKMEVMGNTIIPNEWNTFTIEGSYRISRHFCIEYQFPIKDNDTLRYVFAKNTPLRNNSLSTGFLKENKTWKEAGKVVSDNIYYSAPIRLHICPDKSTIHTFSNVNNDIDIQLYPNPADAMLNVVIKNINEAATIQIYNITGQLLYNQSNINPSETYSIPVSHLATGMYFLKTFSKSTSKVQPFIIE